MDFTASRLQYWIDNKQIFKNRDVDVFVHSYGTRFKELRKMLKAIEEGK